MASPTQLKTPHARARASRRANTRAADYLRSVADVAQVTVDGADASEVFGLIVHEARNLIGAASSTIGPWPRTPLV
jgi:hypothetical protein